LIRCDFKKDYYEIRGFPGLSSLRRLEKAHGLSAAFLDFLKESSSESSKVVRKFCDSVFSTLREGEAAKAEKVHKCTCVFLIDVAIIT